MAARSTALLLAGNPDFMAPELLEQEAIDPDEAFEARKHLLEYDDVMNKQRETIYGLRRQLMEEPDQRDYLLGDPPQAGVALDLLSDLTKQYLNPDVSQDDWDIENYKIQIKTIYDLDVDRE